MIAAGPERPSTIPFMRSGTPMFASFAVTRKPSARRTRPRYSHRYGRSLRMTPKSLWMAEGFCAAAGGCGNVLMLTVGIIAPMPRFAANLHWLFTERPFLERFAAARAAGFDAVEFPSPYGHPPQIVKSQD